MKSYKEKYCILFVLSVLLMPGCVKQSVIVPNDLQCEAKTEPEGIAILCPRLSWKNETCENHVQQVAYQILVASSRNLLKKDRADLWNSGKTESQKSAWITYDGTLLNSRSVAYWKVRVWDQHGVVSGWSEVARFSVGLLEPEDWLGEYIGFKVVEEVEISPLLRESFYLEAGFDELTLHVNSLGYHELYVNGQKVGSAVLSPSESQFDIRSFSISYNLSDYLKKGENAIALWLGRGWYMKTREDIYAEPLVRLQLDGLKKGCWHTLLKSDETWKVSESGYTTIGLGYIPEYGGEILDANKISQGFSRTDFNDSKWQDATCFEVPDHLVTPQVVELNQKGAVIYAKDVKKIDNQVYLVDMGKNLTGSATIHFPELPKGHKVKLEYTDHLTEGVNSLYNKQYDFYISSGEEGEFTSKFNYHAFRYIKISSLPVIVPKESIKAQMIHTGFREEAMFSCSDSMLNEIYDMFAHTLRCLTLGGKIVDCPHFERLGYGGDGNACTMTAQTLFGLSSLYTTWLTHWADCMDAEGSLPHTAPSFWRSGGGPYWCTFIIKAAWETYLNYGDLEVLRTFYPFMVKWLDYVKEYSPNILLEEWPMTNHRSWFLGDWATPDGIDQVDPRSIGLVTNCAIVDSYDKMVKIAIALEKPRDAELFDVKKNTLSQAIHETFYNPANATYATGVQVDLAYPLILGIVPDSLVARIAQSLQDETIKNRDGHFATGLIGLRILTEWVISSEASDLMYEMMTKKDYPGFGYMIENGATTTWEHWDGERSRIHNCYHGAGYWFYQSIGGIRPVDAYPGYTRFILAPRPPGALTWASIEKGTAYGTIKVDWNKEDGNMIIKVTIPPGSMANLQLPPKVERCLCAGETLRPDSDGNIWIESGKYEISYLL